MGSGMNTIGKCRRLLGMFPTDKEGGPRFVPEPALFYGNRKENGLENVRFSALR